MQLRAIRQHLAEPCERRRREIGLRLVVSGQRMRAHHGPVDIIGDMREERRAVTVFESGKNFPDEIRFHSHANSLPRIIARKARWCRCDFQSWRGSTKESDASQICRKRKW